MTQLQSLLLNMFEQGFLFAFLGLGVLITFRFFRFPDLTAEGSYPLGGAVAAALLVQGTDPYLASFAAAGAGAVAGAITALVHTKLRINNSSLRPVFAYDSRDNPFETTRGQKASLAVEYAGEAIGGAGLLPMADVARFTAEVGYWFGEAWWGRGFATEALRRLTGYAFESFQYERLEAWVFATNPASARVLEKAGYEREAILRRSAFKDGRFLDCHLYVRLRPR